MSIKNIIISQAKPMNIAPYASLSEKYGVNIDFRPFYLIEPVSSRDFRAQRINILDYTAIVFSARHAIDAFFQICEELRVKIPDTMKYFCTTEAVAVYLQKYIVFRKRKIFFGNGTPESVVAQIGPKHKGENFLITTSGSSQGGALNSLFDAAGLKYSSAVFVNPVSQDLGDLDLAAYDMAVVYNPADLKSLQENFPDFPLGNLKFVSFGKQVVRSLEEAGIEIEIKAPTPEAPSVDKALGLYLEAHKN